MLVYVAALLSEMASLADIRFPLCSKCRPMALRFSSQIFTVLVRAATATCGQKVFKHEPQRICGSQFQNSVVPLRYGMAIYTAARSFIYPKFILFRPI